MANLIQRYPFLQKASRALPRFLSLNLCFFALLFLLRLYEFLLIGKAQALPENSLHVFFVAVEYDLVLLLLLSALLLLPFLLFSLRSLRAGTIFFGVAILLFVVVDLALLQYFSVTYVPLGADLYGYSIRDIQLTLRSSGGFSILTVVPFIAGAGLVWGTVVLSSRLAIPRSMSVIYVAAALVALVFGNGFTPSAGTFNHESEYYLACNKVGYFTEKTWTLLTASSSNSEWKSRQEYPLMHDVSYEDVLGPFFDSGKTKPNLVFIIVEGLGRSFIGEGAPLGGFTPFLDSLTKQSLYWENFLSTSGRTFAVLPSLFGSLPFAEKGFMELGDRMPAHLSLIKILQEQGYSTTYYYGSNANFDLQDVFLERQKLACLVDEYQFGMDYHKQEADASGFSWGYPDGDLFKRSLEVINERKKDPRLDIYMTISTHEPFLPPNKEHYLAEFNQRLKNLSADPRKRELYTKYQPEFSSLLYLDDAVRSFIDAYKKRPDFSHTIFFITGDHRIIPIPSETKIDRFHVPLLISSPMLKRPQRFSSVSSHADVTPSLLAFLQKSYGISAPRKAHWIGNGIDTAVSFRNIHSQPFMRTKEELVDYLDGDYFLAADQLFRVLPGLDLEESSDHQLRQALQKKLDEFKQMNNYVCFSDKLYSGQPGQSEVGRTAAEDSTSEKMKVASLASDQLFQFAREKVADQKYEDARVICRRMLRNSPNHHDVRTLLGRTFAWERRYDEARTCFDEVIRRAPNYPDAQVALVDVEFWCGNNTHAMDLIDQALKRFPSNQDFLLRKAKVLLAMGKKQEAAGALDQLLSLNPSSIDGLALRNQMSK